VPPADLIVRAIRSDDKFSSLSLGNSDHQPLKTFLKKNAWDYERCSVARTHVLVDAQHHEVGSRVWGYVTLTASEVVTTAQNRPQGVMQWPEKFTVPSVKLARMAIDKELQGKGRGTELLLATASPR